MENHGAPTGGGDRDEPSDRQPPRPKVSYSQLDERALIDAMRAGHSRAIDEFILRYQRLLFDRAKTAGLRRRDCEEAITDVVQDVAVRVVARRLRPTQELAGYVVRCFFNRLADQATERKRHWRLVREGSDAAPGADEAAVLGAVSEYTIRSSHGPDWDYLPLSAPLMKLASMIEEGLTREDDQLLGWHSRYVPLRQIAEWVGVSYATAAQRSWRLRQRLRETAMQYASTFLPKEWREIAAFLDRCAITYDGSPRRKPNDDSPPRTA
jgi:DNA-directed RNA polymerase specialized sigma24 family protein